jgi:hypothetical protein
MGTIFSNSGNCIAVKRWQFVPEDCTNVKNYELTQTGDVWVFSSGGGGRKNKKALMAQGFWIG